MEGGGFKETALRYVSITKSSLVKSVVLLHAVHNWTCPYRVTNYGGFAGLVAKATPDFAKRLDVFKKTFSLNTGVALVTFSAQFGITFNLISDRDVWATELRHILMELVKVLPAGTQISMPLIGTGLWRGNPTTVWKVLTSLPKDYPFKILLYDPSGKLYDKKFIQKPFVAPTTWTIPMVKLEWFENDESVMNFSLVSGCSSFVYVWTSDFEKMRARLTAWFDQVPRHPREFIVLTWFHALHFLSMLGVMLVSDWTGAHVCSYFACACLIVTVCVYIVFIGYDYDIKFCSFQVKFDLKEFVFSGFGINFWNISDCDSFETPACESSTIDGEDFIPSIFEILARPRSIDLAQAFDTDPDLACG